MRRWSRWRAGSCSARRALDGACPVALRPARRTPPAPRRAAAPARRRAAGQTLYRRVQRHRRFVSSQPQLPRSRGGLTRVNVRTAASANASRGSTGGDHREGRR
jgi:hypothetical protein